MRLLCACDFFPIRFVWIPLKTIATTVQWILTYSVKFGVNLLFQANESKMFSFSKSCHVDRKEGKKHRTDEVSNKCWVYCVWCSPFVPYLPYHDKNLSHKLFCALLFATLFHLITQSNKVRHLPFILLLCLFRFLWMLSVKLWPCDHVFNHLDMNWFTNYDYQKFLQVTHKQLATVGNISYFATESGRKGDALYNVITMTVVKILTCYIWLNIASPSPYYDVYLK